MKYLLFKYEKSERNGAALNIVVLQIQIIGNYTDSIIQEAENLSEYIK